MRKFFDLRNPALFFVLSFVLIISIILQPAFLLPVSAEENRETVDFVLVLDCSGSMSLNDAEGLTKLAAEKFIELLPDYNARAGIVVFGDDYGTAAYPLSNQDDSQKRVKIAKALSKVSGDQKGDFIAQIEAETKRQGALSPIGYALETGAKMLEEGGASRGNAAIILLTDGQVEGQSDGYNGDMDYESIDRAISIMNSSDWPIYCMELNYRHENQEGKGLPGIAFHQMRQNIPVATGTEPIELQSADQADEVFNEIFMRFFGSDAETITVDPVPVNKQFEINVPEMTAEETIELTGDVSQITKVEMKAPDGSGLSFETGARQDGSDGVYVNFNDQYAIFKIYAPQAGKWGITVYGTDNAELKATAISLKETTLELEASEPSGELPAGTTVTFDAYYHYDNQRFSSESFYKNYPAVLNINGKDEVVMNGGIDGYTASFTFDKKGAYDVYVYAESDQFRKGRKESGHFSYSIDNEPTITQGQMPDITVTIGKASDPIQLSEYFISPDGDPLRINIDYDKTVQISHQLTEDGALIMQGGEKKGSYEVVVTAQDGSTEAGVQQKFTLNVENQPLELIGDEEKDVTIVYDSNDERQSFTFNWEEYFADPDNVVPHLVVIEDSNQGIEYYQKRGVVEFYADGKGQADITVTAVDASDITEAQSVVFHIQSVSEASQKLEKMKIPIAGGSAGILILLAILIYGFTGRKIYGRWDVYVGTASELERELGTTGNGHKSSCSMSSLLDELGLYGEFGNVRIVAGNKFTRNVSFTNLTEADSVELDGNPIENPKAVSVKPAHSIMISMNGNRVTFERLS